MKMHCQTLHRHHIHHHFQHWCHCPWHNPNPTFLSKSIVNHEPELKLSFPLVRRGKEAKPSK
jgi:hypothetical protein